MQWIQIDVDTASMMVQGGTLYRYTNGSAVALCFVPFVQYQHHVPSQLPYWSPSVQPAYSGPY